MDDEFFDTPRQKPPEKKSSKNSRAVDPERTVSEYSDCNKDSGEPVGKPPAYPDNRPVSAASKQRVNGRKLPAVCEGKLADDPQVQNSRRVIEAKVPCVSVKQGNEESYSDDSFVEEDDGSPIEGSSGRRLSTPRTVKADQRLVSKETSIPGYDVRPHATENRAQDLSDCSGSLTDDAADSDEDSEIVDVSPINTPRDSNVQIASALTKNISKSPDIQPVGLLNADRDSLDLDMLLQTVLHMEKQGRSQSRQAEAELAVTSGSSRRNYSFNRERVEAIEKENLRLATRLMKHANDNKKAKVKVNKLHTSGVSSKRLSSAAVNRAKQQQKIEAENLVSGLFSHSIGMFIAFEIVCLSPKHTCVLSSHVYPFYLSTLCLKKCVVKLYVITVGMLLLWHRYTQL